VWNETSTGAVADFTFGGNFTNNATTFTAQNDSNAVHTFSGTGKIISGSTVTAIPYLTINGTTTNNGTLTVSSTLAGTSTLTNGASGTLNFGGTSITPTLSATASGNTVNYYASGPQNVAGVAYYNLIFSGSGIKSVPLSSPSVAGNLSIAPTGTASAGLYTGLNMSVGTLTLGGLGRINGEWGSSGSSATYKNDTYFNSSALGRLNVSTDNRATPTVTTPPTATGITYGQALSASTLSGGSASVPGGFAFTNSSTIPSSAGIYSASVTFTPTDTTSYTNATTSSSVSVSAKTITITPNDGQTKIYGASDPTFTYTHTALVGSDSINGNLGRAAGETVAGGPYAYTLGNLTAGTNYSLSLASGHTFAITPRPITVTANADSKTYGQTKTYGAGSTAFTSSGLQNGETIGTVTIAASGGTAANASAGSYNLTPSAATGGTFTAGNYTIAYNNGTLTVNPLPVTLTGTRAYDGTANASASILSVSNVIGSDVVNVASGTATLAAATAGPENISSVGSLALGGANASNYTLTGATGSVTIGKVTPTATLSVTNPSSVDYNASAQSATVGITASSVPGSVKNILTGGAAAQTNAGTYAVTADFIPNDSADYNSLTGLAAGNFVINKVALSVVAQSETKTYGQTFTFDGTKAAKEFLAFPLLGTDDVASVTLTSDGAAATAPVLSHAPYYSVVPSAAVGTGLSNYIIAYQSALFTVTKANQTITFNTIDAKTYGDPDFSLAPFASATSGLAVTFTTPSKAICSIGGASSNELTILKAGKCSVVADQNGTDQNGNSNFNPAPTLPQTLTISPATATLTLTQADLSQTYDGNAKSVGFAITPTDLASDVSVSYTDSNGNPVIPTAVGTYGVTATLTNPNYTADPATGSLVINPTYTVTFDKNGGDTDANPASISGVLYNATVTLPTAPTLAGSAFASWNTAKDRTGTTFDATTKVTDNITVYAQWTAVLSSDKAITAFTIPGQIGSTTINETAKTIAVTVPFGTIVTALAPTITITGASVSPDTGVAQDFTNSVTYTVTAEDSSHQDYTATVTVAPAPSSAKDIISFGFGLANEVDTIGSGTVSINVPNGTDVTKLTPAITISDKSTVSPTSGTAEDFTNPVTYTVTAEDSST
jgi:hypothetical protein